MKGSKFKTELCSNDMTFNECELAILRHAVDETEKISGIKQVNNEDVKPNSVQHNVPAWTLFAIFFIIVPLSINIVKEKNQGTMIRLITNPVPYAILLAGKTATYLLICVIQFFLMIAVGIYLFPYLDLPVLDVSGKLFLMTFVAIFSGLAAIGLGILLGTIAKTQEQSAPFGATSVVILAAIGGVWVPVFAMPKIMQFVSNVSPMNWGLNAFYDVLLRNGSIIDILPELFFLLLFLLLTHLYHFYSNFLLLILTINLKNQLIQNFQNHHWHYYYHWYYLRNLRSHQNHHQAT